ncbi:hypothetical protein T484DRAFT_1913828, partial [Baffinella frigidus]
MDKMVVQIVSMDWALDEKSLYFLESLEHLKAETGIRSQLFHLKRALDEKSLYFLESLKHLEPAGRTSLAGVQQQVETLAKTHGKLVRELELAGDEDPLKETLGGFAPQAEERVCALREELGTVQGMFKDTLRFLGERRAGITQQDLCLSLGAFASSFSSAVQEWEAT